MKLLLNMQEAVCAMRANALRSVLTTLGIIFGVAAVIVMISIGSGTQQRIKEEIEQLGTNTLVIHPGFTTSGGARMGAGTRPTITLDDMSAIEVEVPDVAAAAPLIRGRVHMVFGNANWSSNVVGSTNAFFQARQWQPRSGRVFLPEELEIGRKVAVLGATVAGQLFKGEDALGRVIRLNHLTFEVIGVLSAKGQTMDGSDLDDFVLIPLTTARTSVVGRAGGSPRAVHSIVVKASERADLTFVQEEMRQVLRQRHRLREEQEDDFRIINTGAALQLKESSSSALTMLLAAIASISLLVGGIGIMNIMLVSVTERTREIGIRAALGAAPQDLLLQFLVEALTLSLIGAVLGVLLGVGCAVIAEAHFQMRTQLTIEPILLSSIFAAGVGVVFGFYPAWKASRVTPIEALRYE